MELEIFSHVQGILWTLCKVSWRVEEVVDVGAEKVAPSVSSSLPRGDLLRSVSTARWVTVKLLATTFFWLDAFFETLEGILLLHLRERSNKMMTTSNTAPSVMVDGISGCCQRIEPRLFSRLSRSEQPACGPQTQVVHQNVCVWGDWMVGASS